MWNTYLLRKNLSTETKWGEKKKKKCNQIMRWCNQLRKCKSLEAWFSINLTLYATTSLAVGTYCQIKHFLIEFLFVCFLTAAFIVTTVSRSILIAAYVLREQQIERVVHGNRARWMRELMLVCVFWSLVFHPCSRKDVKNASPPHQVCVL